MDLSLATSLDRPTASNAHHLSLEAGVLFTVAVSESE